MLVYIIWCKNSLRDIANVINSGINITYYDYDNNTRFWMIIHFILLANLFIQIFVKS